MATSHKIVIEPSLLAADLINLEAEIAALAEAGAERVHLDVMDGHFVPNISFGADIIRALRAKSSLFFDVHFMSTRLDRPLEDIAQAGADRISIHVELGASLNHGLQKIRQLGKEAGIVLNPTTPASAINDHIEQIGQITVMGVNPGFGGQSYLDGTSGKIREIRTLIAERAIDLAVDGGVNSISIGKAAEAGANILIAGTAVFSGGGGFEKYRERIGHLHKCAQTGLPVAS